MGELMKKHKATAVGDGGLPHMQGDSGQTYYFCMAQSHKDALLEIMSSDHAESAKIFLLNNNSQDILDPYEQPLEVYQETLHVLQSWVGRVLDNINKGAEPFA